MQKVSPQDLTIMSYGMCNLNCVYCTIDKNKYMKQVDEELKKSFEEYETQYVPRILKWFPDKNSLQSLQTWGGEPLWDIERIFPLLDWIIKNYPNYYQFFSSTNFSYPTWSTRVMNLINFFGNYKNREFIIMIQLSMDGPEYINDANRGKGVTKRCVKYLKELVDKINKQGIPENIKLHFSGKPTLSTNNIEKDLTSKEKVIEYYQDLEKNCYSILHDIEDQQNISFSYAVPNVAVPAPDTSYTGKCFANVCRWCRELEENSKEHFKYFETLCPFSNDYYKTEKDLNKLNQFRMGCGTGVHSIMMMPNGYYITCHSAFGDIVDDYKKLAYNSEKYENKVVNLADYMGSYDSSFVKNEEEYEKFSNHMVCALDSRSTAYGEFSKVVIQTLASSGQIEEKYKDELEAINALAKIRKLVFSCTYNNQILNNSFLVPNTDQYRLFLNGALDYICQ